MDAIQKLQAQNTKLATELHQLRSELETVVRQRDAYKLRVFSVGRDLRHMQQLFGLAVHAAGEIRIDEAALVSGEAFEIGMILDPCRNQKVFFKVG